MNRYLAVIAFSLLVGATGMNILSHCHIPENTVKLVSGSDISDHFIGFIRTQGISVVPSADGVIVLRSDEATVSAIVLYLRRSREWMNVLCDNIANLDTPGYSRQSIHFDPIGNLVITTETHTLHVELPIPVGDTLMNTPPVYRGTHGSSTRPSNVNAEIEMIHIRHIEERIRFAEVVLSDLDPSFVFPNDQRLDLVNK